MSNINNTGGGTASTCFDTGCVLPDLQFSMLFSFVNRDFANSGIVQECIHFSVQHYLLKAPVN